MKINNYTFAAALLIFIVLSAYSWYFYVVLGYKLSDDPASWGQLGDFAGGILNPLLSFVSIVLLIKSLTLQNEANINLRLEMKNSEKTEKLRSFESFRIDLVMDDQVTRFIGVKAVLKIEDEIEEIRNSGGEDQQIREHLANIDENDQIFGLSRAFYIMVKIIAEKLSDAEGFSAGDRKAHFMTLVNFTDFAQLRLVMICIQFTDYESTKYLRSSIEFKNISEELGLNYGLY